MYVSDLTCICAGFWEGGGNFVAQEGTMGTSALLPGEASQSLVHTIRKAFLSEVAKNSGRKT